MIVVDASAAVEMFLNTSTGAMVRAELLSRQPAIVPTSFDSEVYASLRRTYLHQRLDRRWLVATAGELQRFVAERIGIVPLLRSAASFADVLGGYDVFYVLIAMARQCPLLTCDARLARAASKLGVEVVAIAA